MDYDEDFIELGKGDEDEVVYGIYFPTYREASRGRRWPIKIGSTAGPLSKRLASFGTAQPEQPRVAVLMWTPNALLLERALQNVLTYRGQRQSSAGGTEWYTTHPVEIKILYEMIAGNWEDLGIYLDAYW